MPTGTDNRGLYLKSIMDTYVTTVPAPKGSNFSRDEVMKVLGLGILGGVKEVSNDNYTILDLDGFSVIIFRSLGANKTCDLPTRNDNVGRGVLIINETGGSYKVIVTPEGADKINGYNAIVDITEKNGWWYFYADSTEWKGLTNGESTKIETATSTGDSGLDLTSAWDDVSSDGGATALTITIPPGKWLLSAKAVIGVEDSSLPSYIYSFFGLGTTAGNNAPNIPYADDSSSRIGTDINQTRRLRITRHIIDCPITVVANTTIYIKSKGLTDELNFTVHEMVADANNLCFIRAKRIV